jgi:hypothetical protein
LKAAFLFSTCIYSVIAQAQTNVSALATMLLKSVSVRAFRKDITSISRASNPKPNMETVIKNNSIFGIQMSAIVPWSARCTAKGTIDIIVRTMIRTRIVIFIRVNEVHSDLYCLAINYNSYITKS